MNDGIISAIYSAPIADRPWVSLLPMLRTLSSASGVMLKFAVPGQRVGARLMPDADWDHEPASSLYEQFYQFKDPVSHEGLGWGRYTTIRRLSAKIVSVGRNSTNAF